MGDFSPEIMLDMIHKEEQRRLATDSLYEFIKQAWPVVEPGVNFVDSWHIRVICDHLEAVSRGELRRLLINIPPRHSKSLIVSVMWPMWEWITSPQQKYLCASYSGTLSIRDNLKARRLIQSPWYQENWSHVFQLSGDQNAKQRFENDKTGYRIATSVGGTATGEGGSRLICLHKNSYIETEYGPVKIGAIVDKQMSVKILAYDHDKQTMVLSDILRFEKSEGRRSMKLTTSSTEIIATHDHPIFVKGKGYIQLSEVQPGDCLLRCVRKGAESKTFTGGTIQDTSLWKRLQRRIDAVIGEHGSMSDMWKAGEKIASTRSKSKGSVLQSQMPRDMAPRKSHSNGRRDAGVRLLSMWKNIQAKKEARTLRENFLFSGLYGQSTQATQSANQKNLRGMRKGFLHYPGSSENPVHMLKSLWRDLAEQKAERKRQRSIHPRKRRGAISAGVQTYSYGYKETGQGMQVVRGVRKKAWDATARTSHRLRQGKQCAGKFNHAVQILPWYDARKQKVETKLVEDVVVVIEPVETPDFVYNVAVDKYRNYFANEILLHNCDDPHSAQEAQSDVIRESALEWFDVVWGTRLNDPKRDAMVTIMQRLHERDISGHIMDDIRGWEQLIIPAEYDGAKRKTSLGYYDPRTKEGELICPDRFGPEEIASLKQMLGVYGASGQLQQDPTPTGGGILKTQYIQLWPHDKGLPQFEYILQSYDCAFTEKTTGDPTACTVWAVFTYNNQRNVMLIDAWDEHLSYPDMRSRVIRDWTAEYGGSNEQNPFNRARRPDRILVEEKASGQSLLQDLRLARVPAVGYNPGRADKISRAHQVAPIVELGLVWVPESIKSPGHPVSWATAFMRQVAKFPVGEHDDYVDTLTQALIYLKNDSLLLMPRAKEIDEPDRRPVKEKVNPYAA